MNEIDLLREIDTLMEKIDWTKYNYMFGIPKNGTIIALLLESTLKEENKRTVEACFDYPENILKLDEEDRKLILIVDDIVDSGSTIKPFIEAGFDTAILFNKNKKVKPTYVGNYVPKNQWINFPFEMEKHEEEHVKRLIEFMGEDANREGLKETPHRVLKFYKEWLEYNNKFKLTSFKTEKYDEMIIVKDIPFYSLCEHHILPFFGKAHVAYIPDKKIVGLSKLARLVRKYAHRLQIQERIGKQVCDELIKEIKPKGVMVVLEAEHLCMSMRGIKAPGHKTVTSEVRGVFKTGKSREEFLELIK